MRRIGKGRSYHTAGAIDLFDTMRSHGVSDISRRHLLKRIPGLAFAAGVARADPLFRATELNHVFLCVSDLNKSVPFYSRLFGPPARGLRSGSVLFDFGSGELGMGAIRGRPVGVDHFCISVTDFALDTVARKLKEQRLNAEKLYTEDEIYFRDRDGILVQLAAPHYRNPRAELLPKSTTPIDPMFGPLSLNHIALRIANLERTTSFYERLFGPAQRQPDRPLAGFRTQSGQVVGWGTDGVSPIGVDHFCVSIEEYEPDRVSESLKKNGISSQRLYRPDQVFVRDPDGILVQLAGRDGGLRRQASRRSRSADPGTLG